MALRECPECDKQISTEAKGCPHCGCPLSRGNKRSSYFGPLLLALFVAAALAIALDQPTKKARDTISFTEAPPTPRCDAHKADILVSQFIQSGIIHTLESNRSVPRISVLENWHHLTLDDKKTIDNAIQCHLMRGIGQPMLAVYHDGRTGKEVAETGPYGFSIK